MPEDRLVAYRDDWDDLVLALAMKIVSGEKDNAETVEAVLARAGTPRPTATGTWWATGGRSSSREPGNATAGMMHTLRIDLLGKAP